VRIGAVWLAVVGAQANGASLLQLLLLFGVFTEPELLLLKLFSRDLIRQAIVLSLILAATSPFWAVFVVGINRWSFARLSKQE
jgi:hypothetical protein